MYRERPGQVYMLMSGAGESEVVQTMYRERPGQADVLMSGAGEAGTAGWGGGQTLGYRAQRLGSLRAPNPELSQCSVQVE